MMRRIPRLERALKHSAVAYALLFAALLYWHLLLPVGSAPGDDAYFASVLAGAQAAQVPRLLGEFLSSRFATWSSRLFIETVLVFVVQAPLLWRVLDALMMLAIPLGLDVLLNPRRSTLVSWTLCTGMMLFPRNLISSAGYITTSVFYIWTAALGLLALAVFVRALEGKRIPAAAAAAGAVAQVYAVNQEQVCAILLGLELALVLWRRAKGGSAPAAGGRRLCRLYILLALLSLLLIAACPGNGARRQAEIQNCFAGYDALSLLTKAEMGFSSVGFYLMIHSDWIYTYTPYNYVFIFFCTLVSALALGRARSVPQRWAGLIPACAAWFFGPLSPGLSACFPHLLGMGKRLTQTGTNPSLLSPASMMPDLVLLLVFACVMVDLYLAFDRREDALLGGLVVLTGLASAFVLAFSPTVWVSGERTCTFLYVCLIAASAMLVREVQARRENGRLEGALWCAVPLTLLLFAFERLAG